MNNTYNRQPISFGSNKDYDRQFMYSSFNGVNDNKNVLSVDQESFADANNIYVSDDNLLVSRPPIKSIGISNVLKVWTFNNKILVLKDDFKLLAYNQLNEEPIAQLQYDALEKYEINCLQVEDKIYVFTNLLISGNPAFYALFVNENKFRDAIDYIYVPITNLVTNNVDSKYESPNFLTSAEKTRFIYSALSFVDFVRLLNQKVEINIDSKKYTINNWQDDNEKVLVNEYTPCKDCYIDVKENSGVIITLKFDSTKAISISFDGIIFTKLPFLNNMIKNTVPYLSQDGLCVFAFTESGLQRCKIAAVVDSSYEAKSIFQWEEIKYLEREENLNIYKNNYPYYSYGYFESEDTYCYVLAHANNILNGIGTDILYAQWSDGAVKRYIYEFLTNFNMDRNPYIKMYRHITQTINEQVSPTILSFILSYDNKIKILFINNKNTETNNYICNGDIVNINECKFKIPEIAYSEYKDANGYFTNLKEQFGNIYSLKIQRWTLNSDKTTVTIDNNKTQIKANELISFVPCDYDDYYDTTLEIGSVLEYGGISSTSYGFDSSGKINKFGKLALAYRVDNNTVYYYNDYYNSLVVGTCNNSAKTLTINGFTYTFDFNTLEIKYNGNVVGKIQSHFNNELSMFDLYHSYDLNNKLIYLAGTTTQYGTITIKNDSNSEIKIGSKTFYFSGDYLGKYYNYGVNGGVLFKNVSTSKLKQDTYTVNKDLVRGAEIIFTDNNNGLETISGKIYNDTSNLKIDYQKAVHINYRSESATFYDFTNSAIDYKILYNNQINDSKIIDNTTTYFSIIDYNIKLVAPMKNGNFISNVINDFIVQWKEDGSTNLPDYVEATRKDGDKTISQIIKIKAFEKSGTFYDEINVNNLSTYNNFAKYFKINMFDGNTILTDKYLYDTNKNKVILLVIKSDNVMPIYNNNNIYYTSNNILYSSYLSSEKQITLDIVTNGNYTQKVFNKNATLNEYFLSFNNLVEITRNRRNADNEFVLYLPKVNEFEYVGNVNDLHLLSSTEVGVFLDSEIWTIKSLGVDSNNTYELWSNIKTKLNLGIKKDSEVVTSIDGSSVIFATPRGIANMHYQENVQSADQILGYLSDAIQYTYDYYKDKAIKFVVYKYLILCYLENDNKILLFDIKRNAWWKWSYKANITRIFAYNDIVYILSNNSLYKFDTKFDDYTDDGDKIDWSFTTQKLHLGSVNNTKFVKRLTIMALGDKKEICKVRANMFRNLNHTVKEDYLDIEIDDLRTLVKVFSFMSVSEFQLVLSTDLEKVDHYQLKINTIGITYQIKGGV